MKKIALVEDNDDHALLIARGLESAEVEVKRYGDGLCAVEAFEKAQSLESRPDLILLDLKMPGLDGFGVMERIKTLEWFSGVPIVVLSTSSRKEEIARAYQLGAAGYVTKSDDFGGLSAKLARVKDYWFRTVEPVQPVANSTGRS